MNVLSIRNLSKSFGQQQIIKNLNMSVPEGSVFGFIGQNGAGKTTTMKMVLGLLQPDQGEILVCNEPVHFGQTKTNQYIGYLPDVPEFYNYMTAMQYLTLCGEIVGLPKESISQKGKKLLSLVGLDGVEKRVGGYSRGMKQRLGIAQALLADPIQRQPYTKRKRPNGSGKDTSCLRIYGGENPAVTRLFRHGRWAGGTDYPTLVREGFKMRRIILLMVVFPSLLWYAE